MQIIFFTHPKYLGLRSMDSFAEMLLTGMGNRGHHVQRWCPEPILSTIPMGKFARKWFGYIDQYLIFPMIVRKKITKYKGDTLFVFVDQALGPWVPIVQRYPHVIHCHDFLALCSAMGEISENPTGLTGRIYQSFIHRGYQQGKNFISVSNNTHEQLGRFLRSQPDHSTVIYNGLKACFQPYDREKSRFMIKNHTGINTTSGYLLHIGGNQWYKNRVGVIEIYNEWRSNHLKTLPLLLIGDAPSKDLIRIYNLSPFKSEIHFIAGLDDQMIRYAYAGASVFLFPSFAEGFGWPIVEAMACGCKVITTREAPMTEVAGDAAFYLSRRPKLKAKLKEWVKASAHLVEEVLNQDANENKAAVDRGIQNAEKFNVERALNKVELFYKKILLQG